MFNIIYNAKGYLPETKIIIGVAFALLLLIYFKGTVGALVTSILVTIIIANSFFAESDIYQISMERAVAGLILASIAFFVNLYFVVRALADWRD
jgi:Mn2+/Fe2+ NRAMP family transporter